MSSAVLLDALGTLVTFADPAPRLRTGLRERFGIEVVPEAARRAIRAEIAYYRDHLHLGRDAAGLAEVRGQCAEVVRTELGLRIPTGFVLAVLLEAIRFEPFPDAAPALRELREAGQRVVVVSNWDVSLHEALDATGLAPLVDGAVASAEIGSAKPDGAIFSRGLALAGVEAAEALHVGDSPEADVAGARAAGVVPVLLDRAGTAPPIAGVARIASLAELRELAAPYPGF